MKECPDCGRLNFTGLHAKGPPIRVLIFPQEKECADCGKVLKESGWFERGHY